MNEEMRKEFEKWFSSYCDARGFNYSFETLLNGEYARWPEHNAFLGWKASREAMKPIKLPMWCMTSDGPSKYLLQYEVIEAIQQAGYKVAP